MYGARSDKIMTPFTFLAIHDRWRAHTSGRQSNGTVRLWVDASYAVHNDMKSHTGGAMSFGRGLIKSKSSKQKLNTKSSTESEVVGVIDYLPNNISTEHCWEAQGNKLEIYTMYQDNASSMRIVSFYVDNCLIYYMITINRTSCLLFANSLTTMSA